LAVLPLVLVEPVPYPNVSEREILMRNVLWYTFPAIASLCVLLSLPWQAASQGVKEAPLIPVSGKVTLDGRPLADAVVVFTPILKGKEGKPQSSGTTDADGSFTLHVDKKRKGAIVGPHRVTISRKIKGREFIPARYNVKTTLTFEVPKKGVAEANIDLASR
jgi:hypothetical protein